MIEQEIINSRAGGVYIPPFKLARMKRDPDDKSSPEYQRQTWEALRKSLNGIINKVNVVNIGNIIPELYQENLIRGRGLFCRALMKAQLTSPGFTHVYAALVAIVNGTSLHNLVYMGTILKSRKKLAKSLETLGSKRR